MSIYFIVVTFDSKKSQIAHLLRQFERKNLKVVENSPCHNLGYGGGANEGIKKALDNGAEWVIVANQDIKITKEAAGEFTKMLETTEPGVAGTFVGRLDPKRWTTILGKEDGFRLDGRNDKKPFDYISGSFMAVHKKVIEKIGLFYEPYFMYYEDADLSVRAKKAGFPLTQINVKGIFHEESTSLGRGSPSHEYYLARNHLLFVERNAPTGVKLREFLRMPKTLWEHYKKGNRGALLGIRDYAIRKFDQFKGEI